MTKEETKNKITKEFRGIKYILTSNIRSKILLSLYENPKKLDELREEIKKPSATILHGLKELETMNLLKKVQKDYKLTSNGFLLTANMIKLIENWNSISKCRSYWDNHDLSDIPDYLFKNIYLLEKGEYISSSTSDLSNAFNNYISLISKAKSLKMILPIYSEHHLKHIVKLLNEDKLKHLEIVISEEILSSLELNAFFYTTIVENKNVEIKCLKKNLKLYLTFNDEFMSLTLFFNDGHYDDSHMLVSKDKDAIKWASMLYSNY